MAVITPCLFTSFLFIWLNVLFLIAVALYANFILFLHFRSVVIYYYYYYYIDNIIIYIKAGAWWEAVDTGAAGGEACWKIKSELSITVTWYTLTILWLCTMAGVRNKSSKREGGLRVVNPTYRYTLAQNQLAIDDISIWKAAEVDESVRTRPVCHMRAALQVLEVYCSYAHTKPVS